MIIALLCCPNRFFYLIDPRSVDGIAEYLEHCGLKVVRRDDSLIEVKTRRTTEEGDIWLLLSEEDVPDLIGDVYRANTDLQDVFDEYIVDRKYK